MKWLLGVLILVGLSLNGPSICEHAFADQSDPVQHDVTMHADMDHSHHAMDHMRMDEPADHLSHCPDDCDGGMDCEGCSIAISMVDQITAENVHLPQLMAKIAGIAQFIASSASPDIPPPKFLFFA
ncbi:MAG: hypothetical protein AAFX02_04460 [Pseudomonadota bacterium]